MSETAELLQAVRARVEKGWCQGRFGIWSEGELGEVCLEGALLLERLVYSGDAPARAERAIRSVLKRLGHKGSIAGFNDKPERTQQEILEVLDRAIEEESR